MILFKNISNEEPYNEFKKYYDLAYKAKEKNIEAIVISSYSKKNKQVDSRFVNLKILDNKNFIFFTNYDSPKANQFNEHNQISAVFFWSSINVQIRMKAKITKTSYSYSHNYFKKRSKLKNALAISSNQSKSIDSFEIIKKNYKNAIDNKNLSICPDYWGGFCFRPFSFEFWRGHENRLNEREVFSFKKEKWVKTIIQP